MSDEVQVTKKQLKNNKSAGGDIMKANLLKYGT